MRAALGLVLVLGACGAPPRSQGRAPGQHHSRPEAGEELSVEQWRERYREAAAEGRVVDALAALDALEATGGTLSSAELGRVRELVNELPMSDLFASEQSAGESGAPKGKGRVAGLLWLRRALVAKHRGEGRDLEKAVEMARAASLEPEELARLDELVVAEAVDARLAAVLLPMSGDHGDLGEELWLAISDAFGGTDQGGKPALVPKLFDTAGSEEGARLAVDRAKAAGAAIILGPVGRLESAAAVQRAAHHRLPVALLNEGRALVAPGGEVVSLVTGPMFEAEQVAYLAKDLGYARVASLVPRDDTGRAQERLFGAASRRMGHELVGQGSYDPSGKELEGDMRDFLNLHPQTNARLRKHIRAYGKGAWKSFSPDVNFDLLYLPDGVERGTLAASFLPYFNVELRTEEDMSVGALRRKHGGRMPRVVQLIGGSEWIDGNLATRGGPALEGTLVVDTCPGGRPHAEQSDAARAFWERFEREMGRPPSTLAIRARDAASLLRRTANGVREARDWPRALVGAQLKEGLCGELEVGANGAALGQVEIYRLEMGMFGQVEY